MENIPYRENLSPEQAKAIEQTLETIETEEDAWEYYARAVLGHSATGETNRAKIIRGLQAVRGEIHEALCEDERVQWFVQSNEASDSVGVALVLTGKLVVQTGLGIDVIALGILITRIGLRRFCDAEFDA